MVRSSLDVGAAERALRPLADGLGLDVVATAAGIVRVADAQMANLIRTSSLERGHDPRRFTLVAYGGAGPLHVGRFGADLGFAEALIPPSASVLSALGLATADHRRTYRRSRRLRLPVDPEELGIIVAELRREALDDLSEMGIAGGLTLVPWAAMRYRRQTHHLRTPIAVDATGTVDASGLGATFEALYARTFGPGTGYAAAGIEITAVGLDATAERGSTGPAVIAPKQRQPPAAPPRSAQRPTSPLATSRPVWFDGWRDTPILARSDLAPGRQIDGPAIIDWGSTSVVVHPEQTARVDELGVAHLRFGREGSA